MADLKSTMKNSDIFAMEQECEVLFRSLIPVYNACTSENFPLVFASDEDYKAGMSILAISAGLFPRVKILSFQLMSNHAHFVISGDAEYILEFFSFFRGRLAMWLDEKGGSREARGFDLKLFPIEDLDYLRNAVAYVNRNGSIVNDAFTPLSYPWGTSAYMFQPLTERYISACGRALGVREMRSLMHSKCADCLKSVIAVDGYASPLSFCDIRLAESLFRNARQYFYTVSKKVEAFSRISKMIGEMVCFTDNDIFIAATEIANRKYGIKKLVALPAGSRIELARCLHYDYNAGDKQIQRLLKLDLNLVRSLF